MSTWGGRMERDMKGKFRREGRYVYLWLIHVEVWHRTAKFYKAIIFQLKINKIFKNSVLFFPPQFSLFRCFLSQRRVPPFTQLFKSKHHTRLLLLPLSPWSQLPGPAKFSATQFITILSQYSEFTLRTRFWPLALSFSLILHDASQCVSWNNAVSDSQYLNLVISFLCLNIHQCFYMRK